VPDRTAPAAEPEFTRTDGSGHVGTVGPGRGPTIELGSRPLHGDRRAG
jgi:hypothetical protein